MHCCDSAAVVAWLHADVMNSMRETVDALGQASRAGLRTGETIGPRGTIVWEDHFDEPGVIDATNWRHDLGKGPNGDGWGNNEWQTYTDGAAHVGPDEAGVSRLVIPVKFHGDGANPLYTSAKLLSKYSFTYGRVDIRAKVATTHGSWSAIWMLPDDASYGGGVWPDIGEIDIMEHVGMDVGVVHGTIHTRAYNHMISTQLGRQVRVDSLLTRLLRLLRLRGDRDWHIYTMKWTEDEIVWARDGLVYNRFGNDGTGDYRTWPFDQNMHLILNVAIGGNWGGQKGVDYDRMRNGDTDPGNVMEIDWVTVSKV